ncbi:Protein-tyrosine phosphatase containing protein [Aphelenchoides avenae]|nr:Protein-tyrosine phosphatase containing protein [Aphelenchus avenae]
MTLERLPRYFHNVTGDRARELLFLYGVKGEFLLRRSESSPVDHTLSVHRGNRVTHVKVPCTNGIHRLPTGEEFSNLDSLVRFLMETPNHLAERDGTFIEISAPVRIPDCEHVVNIGRDRFFHHSISGPEAEELLKDEPNGTYLNCPEGQLQNAERPAGELHSRADGPVRRECGQNLHREKDTRLFISCKEGRKPDNLKKNRYRNVVPYDHTRIQLVVDDDNTNGDYINANMIEILADVPKYSEFTGLTNKYISTQGCLQNTIDDFWRMVWQENSRIIVMVTKEVERGRVKCCRYWPEVGEEQTFGPREDLCIRNMHEDEYEDYTARIFQLTKKGQEGTPRKIFHYQFMSWEDNGCPSDSVLAFLEEVNQCQAERIPEDAGPTVVHCSAGIGRTGTYIVLDILIRQIKRFGPQCSIDIPKTIRMVREQRATMVQTVEQYRFIYHAISSYMKMRRAESQEGHDGARSTNGSLPATPTVKLSLNGNAEHYHNLTPSPTNSTSPGLMSTGTPTDNSAPTSPFMADEPFNLAPPPLPKKKTHRKMESIPMPEQHRAYVSNQ